MPILSGIKNSPQTRSEREPEPELPGPRRRNDIDRLSKGAEVSHIVEEVLTEVGSVGNVKDFAEQFNLRAALQQFFKRDALCEPHVPTEGGITS